MAIRATDATTRIDQRITPGHPRVVADRGRQQQRSQRRRRLRRRGQRRDGGRSVSRAGSGIPGDVPRPAGGHHAVAGEAGRIGIALEEGAVGRDELDFDGGDPAACGPLDQGVGHDLCARDRGSPSERRVSACRVRGGVHSDALGDREQGSQGRHGARGRAETDKPFDGGVAGALGRRPYPVPRQAGQPRPGRRARGRQKRP